MREEISSTSLGISAFEPVLLEQVLIQIKSLYDNIYTAHTRRQIIENFDKCRSTIRLLKEIRTANETYGVPYLLYTENLMQEHEQQLDDISLLYRKSLVDLLDRSPKES